MRRDFGQLLRAIKAHALLHREHRNRDEAGAIKATFDDYAIVRSLMGDLLSTASELKMRKQIAETIAAVQDLELQPGSRANQDSEHGFGGVKVRQVADALNLDRSTAQRRLRKAVDDGYLTNLEHRPFAAARYRTAEAPTCEFGVLLPTPEELQEAVSRHACAGKRPKSRAQAHATR